MRIATCVRLMISVIVAAPVAAQDAKLVDKGAQLFVEQKCTLCHSIAGQGNKKAPLEAQLAKSSADEMRQWIVSAKEMTAKTKAERKPVMKVYTLPKEDVDALVAYLASVKKK